MVYKREIAYKIYKNGFNNRNTNVKYVQIYITMSTYVQI